MCDQCAGGAVQDEERSIGVSTQFVLLISVLGVQKDVKSDFDYSLATTEFTVKEMFVVNLRNIQLKFGLHHS